MDYTVITAVLSLVGTLAGSLSGIMISNRMTNYRIEQLEKRVEQHNSLGERTTLAEHELRAIWRRMDEQKKVCERRHSEP